MGLVVGGHGQSEPELGLEATLCGGPLDELERGVVELEARGFGRRRRRAGEDSGAFLLAGLSRRARGWGRGGFGACDELKIVVDHEAKDVGERVVMGAAFGARGEQ